MLVQPVSKRTSGGVPQQISPDLLQRLASKQLISSSEQERLTRAIKEGIILEENVLQFAEQYEERIDENIISKIEQARDKTRAEAILRKIPGYSFPETTAAPASQAAQSARISLKEALESGDVDTIITAVRNSADLELFGCRKLLTEFSSKNALSQDKLEAFCNNLALHAQRYTHLTVTILQMLVVATEKSAMLSAEVINFAIANLHLP